MSVHAPEDTLCRCDNCKYRQDPPGTEAVLYTGPDAVTLLIEAAIRDGRYEDIHAFADEAVAHVHLALNAAARKAHRALWPAIRAWNQADAAMKAEPAEALPDFRVAEKMTAALMPGGLIP